MDEMQEKIVEEAIKTGLPLVYKDALQPAVKKFGISLSRLITIPTFFLNLITYFPRKWNAQIEHNMKKFLNTLDKNVKMDNIAPIAPEIGLPGFERLIYVQDEDIKNALIQLLVNASSQKLNHLSHPRFLAFLLSLSNDEIKILKFLYSKSIPCIYVGYHNNNSQYLPIFFTPTRGIINLSLENNEHIYFTNMKSLGLIEEKEEGHLMDKQVIARLEYFKRTPYFSGNEPEITYESVINMIENNTDHNFEYPDGRIRILIAKGSIRLTNLGYLFADSCII